jgi:hypothetical protein
MTRTATMHEGPQFYMYVGYCITAWANVEEELFDICADVLGCKLERAAIVYYRLPSLSVRLGLVDELVTSGLPERSRKNGGHDHPDLRTWIALKDEITELTRTRSRIAHHPVNHDVTFMHRETGEPITKERPVPIEEVYVERSYSISISRYERLRGKEKDRPLKPLTADDLSVHCMALQRLAAKIKIFRAAKLARHLSEVSSLRTPGN